MQIRQATNEDAATLATLSCQLGYPTSCGQVTGRLSIILDSQEHLVLVACEDNGLIIGWIHVFLALRVESDSFAELGGFVVAEEHRGRGIGRQLLCDAEQWASDHGVAKLRVRSRSSRHSAHGFYERLGFSRTKEQLIFDKPLLTGHR